MTTDLRKINDLDRLIHEPARLMILTILAVTQSADFLFLERETGLTRGNLSTHLGRLEEAGYIRIEKTYKGKLPLTVCKLTSAGEKAFNAYRSQLLQIVRSAGK